MIKYYSEMIGSDRRKNLISNTLEMISFGLVCEYKTMTAASKVMGCSTAQISRHISNLEKNINAKLFYRTTRKLTLTDVGLLLKPDAINLVNYAQMIDKKLENHHKRIDGKFTITAPISFSSHVLIPLFPHLQQKFPNVDFELIPTDDNLKLIDKGIDLAIRTGAVVDDLLIAHQIGKAYDIFCTSKEYLRLNNEPKTLSDLDSHPVFLNRHSINDSFIKLNDSNQSFDWFPQKKGLINLYPSLLELAYKNEGIVFIPNYFLNSKTNSNNIVQILDNWKGEEWPIYMVYPFQTPTPPKLDKISLFLKAEIKKLLVL